jgi:DHA2 family multidrug resistance protein-like MFS transporter
MSADLRPTPNQLLWINDIYGFMVGGTMIIMGTLGDRIGRRRLIVICAAVFAIASVVAAFSVAPWMVIVSRAVMGVAGSAIMPASMALIRQIFPDPQQAVSAMGVYMGCFLGGMAAAPLIGGLMVEYWWWGGVFLLGVPVMLVTVVGAPRLLPEFRDPGAGRLDLLSAAQCVSAILLLVYALKAVVNNSELTISTVLYAVGGVVVGWFFIRRQKRLDDPLVDLDFVRRPGVARTATVLFLTALVMGGTSLFVGFYLQSVQGLTPFQAALWLLPQMITMIVASNVGPRLGQRFPASRVMGVSFVIMAIGFAIFSVIPTGIPGLIALAAGSALTTAGIGSVFPYLMNTIISEAPEEKAGFAASLAQTFNELGIAMGLVVLGSVATVTYRAQLQGNPDESWVDGFARAEGQADPAVLDHVRDAFTAGFHAAGATALAIMATVIAIAVGQMRSDRKSAVAST